MVQSVVAPVAEEVKPVVVAPKPAPQPKVTPAPSVVPTPTPIATPAPATPAPTAEPIKVVEQSQRPAMSSAAANSMLSGTSISSLLRGAYGVMEEATTEESGSTEDKRIDPQTEAKLEAAREAIVDEIKRERPRFIVGFETMQFAGHKIKLLVPSEALRHDIAHASTELLFKIAEIADVKGLIEFDITVREEERKMRPIRLEDRMAHIEKRNPLYLEFKAALDLDVE